MNNELIDLQIRLSHQENHIQELDKVIYQQQQQLDGLRTKIDLMEKHIRSLSGTNILAAAEEQPPPHY